MTGAVAKKSSLSATILVIMDFLISLREDHQLSVPTMLRYCAALAQVFPLMGLDLSSSPELATLVMHFQVDLPTT